MGILLPGETVPVWQKRAIETMVAETDVEITHLVIHADSTSTHLTEFLHDASSNEVATYMQQCYNRLGSHALWSLLGIVRQLTETPEYRRPCHIDMITGLDDAKALYCEPVADTGFGNHLPDHVTETVGRSTDVVIRFGFGILTDPILSIPRHGVLSFHRGDLRSYRGQPGGLWEFLHDEPSAGITLQRIDDSLDAGEVIVEDEVSITDAHTWREVERRQIEACEGMLAVAIDRLQDPDSEPIRVDQLGALYTIPRGREVLTYVKKTLLGNLREFVEAG
ncbi:formyltransferase family protein [Haladaptatus sp. CMAA 1911]|uniref:formyltransferase family protein n=1 Tax=unclassified Haladaptatus TaxID=2622732 RepID=UPI0037542977